MKTKNIIAILAALPVMGVTLTACSSDDITDAKPAKEILMVVGGDVIQYRANETGPAQEVNISADCRWTVELDEGNFGNDIAVSPRQGNGNGSLVITSNQNTDPHLVREATVTLMSDGGLKQKITVRQTGGDEALNVSRNSFSFTAEPTEAQTLTIDSNTSWTLHVPDGVNWLHLDKTTGSSGSTTVQLRADNAITDAVRSTILSLTYAGGSAQIEVTQEGMSFVTLSATPENVKFSVEGGSQAIHVESNSEWHAYVPSSVDWLTVTDSVGIGSRDLYINCSYNETNRERITAVVIVAGSKNPKQAVILVEQAANGSYQPLQTSVTLSEVSVTRNSALFVLNVTSDEEVGDFGVIYGTGEGDERVVTVGRGGLSQGKTVELTGLQEGTSYYVRAFVQKRGTEEIIYSDMFKFVTLVSTAEVGEITSMSVYNTSAEFRYTFVVDNGVTEYGLVYSTSDQLPTYESGTVHVVGTEANSRSVLAVLNGLQQNTTYYVRAYVRALQGTIYSPNVVTITTSASANEPGESDNPDPQLARWLW